MKKLKLLHITRPTEFGIYRFLVDLIKYTRKDKFEIAVACPLKGPLAENLHRAGIRVIPLEMQRNISPLNDIRSFFSIMGILKKEKWDILHAHCSKAGFLGRIAAKLSGVPVKIYTPNSWYFDEPLPAVKKQFYIFLEKLAAYFGDRIVTVTEEERGDIIKKGISPSGKVVTIYDGIDVTDLSRMDASFLRDKYGIPKLNKVVGMIARLVSQKMPCDFVKLAHEVTKENHNVTFILIGDGPLRAEVENLKSQLKLGNKLIMTGACEINKEVKAFLNLMDISVLTSLYEGLPLVALASMYLKKPLIITKVRGIDEVVQTNRNGFIVPIGGIDSMKNIISGLLTDEARARQIGLAARTTVEQHFTADKMAHAYEKLYLSLVK